MDTILKLLKKSYFILNFILQSALNEEKMLYSQRNRMQKVIFRVQSKISCRMKQTINLYMELLPNGAHYTLVQSVRKRAKGDATLMSHARLAPLIANLEAAFLVEEEKFKISQKSEFTDTLNNLDKTRGRIYMGLKGIVRSYAKIPDATIETAVRAVGQLITDYRINIRVQRDQESGLLSNFVADLENKCAAHVQTLHLQEVVQMLKQANNQYIAVRDSRTEERMQKQQRALLNARAATDKAYRTFIAMVNALAMVEGEDSFASFIDYMNALINEYKTEVLNLSSTPSASAQPDTEDSTTPDAETPDTIPDEPAPDNGEEDEGLAG